MNQEVATGDAQIEAPKASTWYYPSLVFASTTLWSIILGPVLTTIPGQVDAIDPDGRVASLALVVAVGGIVGIVTNPIIGHLSDHTRSRLGRRRPWILIGALLIVPTTFAAGSASSIFELTFWWSAVQLSANLIMGPLTATIPDLVPPNRRGVASSCLGISWAMAPVLGSAVQAFMGEPQLTFLVLGLLILVAQLLFMLTLRADHYVPAPKRAQKLTPSKWTATFALLWVHRFFFALGQNVAISYLFFYIQDVIKYEQTHPGSTTDEAVLILTAIYGCAVVVAAVLIGWLADRSQRYKVYLVGATLVFVSGAFLGAFTGSWDGVLVLAALTGIGFGAYEATSMAVVIQQLPSEQRRARDLSFINMAALIAIAIGPAVAATLIQHLGYVAMFAGAGTAVLTSGIIVLFIKRSE